MVAKGNTYGELAQDAFYIAGIQMAEALNRREDDDFAPLRIAHLLKPEPTCATCQRMGLVCKFGTRGSKKPTMSH